MQKFEDINAEINEAFKKEGLPVIQKAISNEIEKNESQLANVRNAMRVLEHFAGNGLPEGMPLGEALGFLEAELEKRKPEMNEEMNEEVNEEMNEDEVRRAREFLASLVDEKYPAGMQIGALMEDFSKEEKKLLKG